VTDTLPRARLHAAGLAVAARTDDAARAALLDYLAESDDPELRDRAELVRVIEEWDRVTDEIVRLEMSHGIHDYLNNRRLIDLNERGDALRIRIAALQSRLSAWPCPECSECDFDMSTGCVRCNGTSDTFGKLPLAWDCGYPRWATLPTTADAVGVSYRYRDEDAFVRHLPEPEYRPTPRLRALASVPPWGVPLEGVRVGDRKPDHDRKDTRAVWFNRDQVSDAAGGQTVIPEPVYTLLLGYDNVPCPPRIGKWYPTESAAQDALARAFLTFARKA
jgi:hypothetical protein